MTPLNVSQSMAAGAERPADTTNCPRWYEFHGHAVYGVPAPSYCIVCGDACDPAGTDFCSNACACAAERWEARQAVERWEPGLVVRIAGEAFL